MLFRIMSVLWGILFRLKMFKMLIYFGRRSFSIIRVLEVFGKCLIYIYYYVLYSRMTFYFSSSTLHLHTTNSLTTPTLNSSINYWSAKKNSTANPLFVSNKSYYFLNSSNSTIAINITMISRCRSIHCEIIMRDLGLRSFGYTTFRLGVDWLRGWLCYYLERRKFIILSEESLLVDWWDSCILCWIFIKNRILFLSLLYIIR